MAIMDDLAKFISDVLAFRSEEIRLVSVERNEFLIREGMIENYLYLVEEGAFRIMYLTELEEHTIRLGYKGSIFTSLASFFTGEPSEFYIQALRRSKVQFVPKTNLTDFVKIYPDRLVEYNLLLQGIVIQQLEREIDLMTDSPVERLQRVLKRSPHLFQEVPAKYIAAYLRMTPETLSRIRKS